MIAVKVNIVVQQTRITHVLIARQDTKANQQAVVHVYPVFLVNIKMKKVNQLVNYVILTKKVQKQIRLFVINVVLVRKQYNQVVLNVLRVMLEKLVQEKMVYVNHASKVVTVMLPWVLLLVLFVPLVGRLKVVEVANVVNAKLVDIIVQKEKPVKIAQKVRTAAVKWLPQSVTNVKLARQLKQLVPDGKQLLLFF